MLIDWLGIQSADAIALLVSVAPAFWILRAVGRALLEAALALAHDIFSTIVTWNTTGWMDFSRLLERRRESLVEEKRQSKKKCSEMHVE